MIEQIKIIAPTLTAALNGPLAGVASKFLIDRLGGDNVFESNSSNEIIEELLKDTKNLKKIKAIEEEFKVEMKAIYGDVSIEKLTNETEIVRKKNASILPQTLISTIFLIAYFMLLGAMFYVEVSDDLNTTKSENSLLGELQILFGVVTAGVGQIFGYWFGSSPAKKK